jgi:enoyl-CoA hydratase
MECRPSYPDIKTDRFAAISFAATREIGTEAMDLIQSEFRTSEDSHDGSVGIITLSDPARRNALSSDLVAEFIHTFDEIESMPEVRAIVVTGVAPAFCAGADLGRLGAEQRSPQSAEEREDGLRQIYAAFLRTSSASIPTIAAVNGPAVGAGMNLALACDIRIAGSSARFDPRFLDLGLHPGGGHAFLLNRAVGSQATNAMVLFGQTLNASEAVDRGLVWRCVDDDMLIDEAVRLGLRAASVPRELLEKTKATLYRSLSVENHAEAVDLELVAQTGSLDQPIFLERLASFRNRRNSDTTVNEST